MPSTALVIGPGVQGRFGAVPAESPAQNINPEYGNAAAFASFTAASGEVRPAKPKKKHSSNGRASRGEGDREGRARVAAEAAERRAQDLAVEGEPTRPKPAGRQISSSSAGRQRVELPPAPLLPPIRNLAPFPSAAGPSETLAHMPSAATAPTVNPPQGMSALDEQLANDAALALALSGQDDFGRDDGRSEQSGAYSGTSRSTSGPSNVPQALTPSPLATPPIAQGETADGAAAVDEPRASKADRRFAAVQASLAKERARQAEADKARSAELQAREARRAEEARKRAEEEKQRKVQEQWELWEEIRRRERKAGLPPPPVANRLED
jgi:hypothetical protein